jgi:hypothetical protein
MRSNRSARGVSYAFVALVAGCAARDAHEKVGAARAGVTTDDLASLALANVGGTACGTNSLGGAAFDSSCTGNGGQPEYWCADFVKWVWENQGVDVSGLSAAAGSFYVYGQNHGTLSDSPAVGDAVVFDYQGGGYADHVAIVTQVYGDGTIETASGDWNGQSGSEAYFSSTSSVVLNDPPYDATVGTQPGVIGMTISGFIAPVAVGAGGGGGPPPPSGGGGPCAGLDDGFYCGGDGVAGDPSTLYRCAAGALAGSQPCAHGCQSNPGNQDDICGCQGLNDGMYCGQDDVGGDPSSLYRCAGGTLSLATACPNGCIVEPGAMDDQCQ